MSKKLLILMIIATLCGCGGGIDADDDTGDDDDDTADDDTGDDDTTDDDTGDDDNADDDTGDDDNGITCTHYVSTSGIDSPKLGDENNPWRTISYGANIISPGDVLCVMSGTYEETIDIGSSGTASDYKTIRKHSGTVVINGENTLNKALDLNGESYWHIQGIDMMNFPEEHPFYITGSDTSYITISDCDISNFYAPISIASGAHHITLDNLTIHDLYGNSSANSLNIMQDPHDIEILNCEIYDNDVHNGINFGHVDDDVAENVTIDNCYIHDIAQIGVGTNCSRIEGLVFTNNIVHTAYTGVRVSCRDCYFGSNEVYNTNNVNGGMPFGTHFDHSNYGNVFEDNYIHDNDPGYNAIEIRSNAGATVINTTQSGQAGYVRFEGGDQSDNFAVDHEDGATIRLDNSGGITFQFTDDRDFSVTGGGTIGGITHSGGISQIIATTNSTTTWTIHHDGTPLPFR